MTGDKFGAKVNAMPKYVVSTRLADEDADWTNSTVIRGDVPGEIGRLKERLAGGILVAGSARLEQALAGHDLVDYRLTVFLIVLGSGRRLFAEGTAPTVLHARGSRPRLGPRASIQRRRHGRARGHRRPGS